LYLVSSHSWHHLINPQPQVIFLGAPPVEVNFSSTGRAQRGQGEVFDYAQATGGVGGGGLCRAQKARKNSGRWLKNIGEW